MKITSLRIISTDLKRMVRFFEQVTRITAQWYTDDFAELVTDTATQVPTTMPWGNRSLLFRDPDGNLINFFTPVTADAIKKFN